MKKRGILGTLLITAACAISMFTLTACAAEKTDAAGDAAATESTTETNSSDTLVVFFSATGTTKGVAERLAAVTDADLYEIIPKEPYTSEDLNYNDSSTRATREQNEGTVRPEIDGEPISLTGYKTIFIGYPIWWGEEPRIMDTFVEANDFDGIALVPFCTSGGSGIGRSGKNLEENAGSGTWLDGERFDGDVSEDELTKWVEGLDLEG